MKLCYKRPPWRNNVKEVLLGCLMRHIDVSSCAFLYLVYPKLHRKLRFLNEPEPQHVSYGTRTPIKTSTIFNVTLSSYLGKLLREYHNLCSNSGT